jgi:hypothetical protein
MIGFSLARTHQGARSIAIPTRTNASADHQRCTLGLVSRADLMHEINVRTVDLGKSVSVSK